MTRLDAFHTGEPLAVPMPEQHRTTRELRTVLGEALERAGYPIANPDGSFSYALNAPGDVVGPYAPIDPRDGPPPSEPWHRPQLTPGNAEG